MGRTEWKKWSHALLSTAVALSGGCASTGPVPKEHASVDLLGSGAQPRVSRRQAADVQIALGRQMEAAGDLEGARPAYVAALKKDPKRADAEHRLAILDDRKGDQAGADRHFDRALALEPKDPEILGDRGYSLYVRRRWSDAEASLRKALAVDPSVARNHTNLGLVLARKGDEAGALLEFARAGCDPSDARTNLALVLATEGHLEDSRREYALALVAKPGSSAAREGLKASSVALSGRAADRAIAASGPAAAPTVDPSLVRTSAVRGPQ